jgi:hypothetical protein
VQTFGFVEVVHKPGEQTGPFLSSLTNQNSENHMEFQITNLDETEDEE